MDLLIGVESPFPKMPDGWAGLRPLGTPNPCSWAILLRIAFTSVSGRQITTTVMIAQDRL